MKILMVTSETVPFAKTGGLADAVSALALILKKQGHDVRIVMPRYYKIDRTKLKPIEAPLAVAAGQIETWVKVYESTLPSSEVPVYFIDHEQCFGRDGIYGTKAEPDFHDNPYRSAVLCHGAFQICRMLGWYPDIMHAHDWFCALVPVLLKHVCRNGYFAHTASVFTIHNLGYQGWYSKDSFPALGLDWNLYHGAGLERNGCINLLQSALSCADMITTVSPTYAQEIKCAFFAHGLENIIVRNESKLCGILNGIDIDYYNPKTDKCLFSNYSIDDLSGKEVCKTELQKMLNLPERKDVPIIAIISRLVSHKGLDLVRHVLENLLTQDVQVVILGKGEIAYENYFTHIANTYSGKCVTIIAYNQDLSRKIYSGADIFLMPSKSEPCGLSQMIASRYGTVPVVRETGGLNDSIKAYRGDSGNGFTFADYNAHDMLNVISQAVRTYKDKTAWSDVQRRAMTTDFSWKVQAGKYEELYNK